MDTREVVARFEAQSTDAGDGRPPNIASVLDGGPAETGRPYFVMELVKGIPSRTPASRAERWKLISGDSKSGVWSHSSMPRIFR